MKYLVADLTSPVHHLSCAKAKFKETKHIWRTLDEHELFIVTEGELHVEQNGVKYLLKAGDVFISDRKVPYGGYDYSTCVFHWQHFIIDNYEIIETDEPVTSERNKFYIPMYFHMQHFDRFSIQLTQLEQYTLDINSPASQLIRDCMMTAILSELYLISLNAVSKESSDYRFLSIIEYFSTSPYLTEFNNVKSMAEFFGYNEKYLIRVFKNKTGITPLQYFINKKMSIAKKMLTDQSITVENIAISLGYEYQYFIKLFKKKVGMTPTEYRKAVCPDWKRWTVSLQNEQDIMHNKDKFK